MHFGIGYKLRQNSEWELDCSGCEKNGQNEKSLEEKLFQDKTDIKYASI
jgi:hypothetical protein